ncbi:hypothetical protein C2S51_005363 [Perilla frutescens var. frutescens]|nr:hypothetical protein C2S51_005363 [Perilla frutescens var. frutescens]
MLKKKHLINTYAFLNFDFYADKMVAFILATAAGTAFGATMELKNVKWENNQDNMEDFLTVEYISAAFILVGSIACGISSIHSSLALTNIN